MKPDDMMPSPHKFKNISIGDLLIQQIPNPLKIDEFLRRRGIIINIQNNISTIDWTIDGVESNIDLMKTTVILNSSLRKMIMDGYIQHYPVQK
jgi:hypothetical protein